MRRNPLVFVPLAAAVVMAGCFNPFSPQVLTQRVTTVAPSPTTPQNAVKLFEWCWKNRGVEEYKELFTADYLFASATTDSAGNTTRDVLTYAATTSPENRSRIEIQAEIYRRDVGPGWRRVVIGTMATLGAPDQEYTYLRIYLNNPDGDPDGRWLVGQIEFSPAPDLDDQASPADLP